MPVAVKEKEARTAPGKTAPDSYVRVKSVMDQVLADEHPHRGLLKSVLADIKSLVERAERVRKLAPELAGVEVSPYIYKMLKMADHLQQQ
jgi:hypothetical protein